MTTFRQSLIAAVQESRCTLPFQAEVRDEQGLLCIEIALDQPAFNRRKEIGDWMDGCIVSARANYEGAGRLPLFRGVDRASLERALRQGIDVVPTDAHWYGADLEKALEYGGDYPAILIIDANKVERPFREIASDAPDDAHREASEWAKGQPMPSRDGRWLLYSRLPKEDSRRGSPYELQYSWYIPGEAREALIGVIEFRAQDTRRDSATR